MTTTRGLRLIVDALAARTGGGRRVATELGSALARRPEVSHLWLLVQTGTVGPDLPAGPKVTVTTLPFDGSLGLTRRVGWQAFALPKLCRDVEADAVISLAGMLPRGVPCPTIAMPANTLVFESGSALNRLRRRAVLRTARQASTVLVASEHMATHFNGQGRVEVVPHGVDHGVFTPADTPGRELVYVADFYEHKRHELAIEAWARLEGPRPSLRLVGAPSTDRTLAERIRKLGEEVDRERFFMESLDTPGIVDAYRRARVALMPSMSESFCLPLVEAAACGVPVVASDLPALRVSGGPGATYVDSDDPGAWAAAIHPLLTDDAAHGRAREAALEHAQGFSWERKAEAVIASVVRA